MNVIRQKHRVIFDPDAVSEEDMTDSIKHEFTRRIRIGPEISGVFLVT